MVNSKATCFISYAHEDEELREELGKHLSLLQRQGILDTWHDRMIAPGEEWASKIDQELSTADLVLLLISNDFLASSYCYEIEVQEALKRHAAGDAIVIPIIVRPVDWASAPFGKLQALPRNAKPVTEWKNRDAAFTDVAKGIRKALSPSGDQHQPGRLEELEEQPSE